MSTPNDLDIGHIMMLAQETLPWHRRDAVTCIEQGTGIVVRTADPADLDPVETDLRRYGYRVERASTRETTPQPSSAPSPPPAPYIRVTGWSPDGLKARREALATAIDRLLDALESTPAKAVDNYLALRSQGYTPAEARKRGRTVADLRHEIAEVAGPLAYKSLAPDDPHVRALVAENDRLHNRVSRLLHSHGFLVRDTIDALIAHGQDHSPADAERQTLADIQAEVTRFREQAVRDAKQDLWHDAERWIGERADDLALGFADWCHARYDPNRVPDLGEAFRQWVAAGLTDADGVDVLTGHRTRPSLYNRYPADTADTAPQPHTAVADSAAQLGAAGFPGPPTETPPPASSTEPSAEPHIEPPAPKPSPRRGAS